MAKHGDDDRGGEPTIVDKRKEAMDEYIAEENGALVEGPTGPDEDAPLGARLITPVAFGELKPLPKKINGGRGHRRTKKAAKECPIDDRLLDTAEAARFVGFKTTGGLRKAWYKHEVFPIGRRGGKNTLMWKPSELYRFAQGLPIKAHQMAGLMLPESRDKEDESDDAGEWRRGSEREEGQP